jgi:hypothetical protein
VENVFHPGCKVPLPLEPSPVQLKSMKNEFGLKIRQLWLPGASQSYTRSNGVKPVGAAVGVEVGALVAVGVSVGVAV